MKPEKKHKAPVRMAVQQSGRGIRKPAEEKRGKNAAERNVTERPRVSAAFAEMVVSLTEFTIKAMRAFFGRAIELQRFISE